MKTVLLYETVYPGIVVSPAPGSEIHEPTTPGVEELALGAGAALLTAGLLTLGPLAVLSLPVKILLTGGAFAGAALAKKALKEPTNKMSRSFQVSPAPASQVHYPTVRGVEEI